MEFIGKDGWPAPLLKNAEIDSIAEDLYLDCVQMMRDLYRKCRLVHAGMQIFILLTLRKSFAK